MKSAGFSLLRIGQERPRNSQTNSQNSPLSRRRKTHFKAAFLAPDLLRDDGIGQCVHEDVQLPLWLLDARREVTSTAVGQYGPTRPGISGIDGIYGNVYS